MVLTKTGRGIICCVLLTCSNSFMTTAWYLHLKHDNWSMVKAIGLSWLIAFFEYCMQVPANRVGHVSNGGPFAAPQLKVVQELLSLSAFAVFSTYVLGEKLRWTDGLGFLFIMAGVIIAMVGRAKKAGAMPPPPDMELLLAPPPPMPPPPPPQRHG